MIAIKGLKALYVISYDSKLIAIHVIFLLNSPLNSDLFGFIIKASGNLIHIF